MKRLLREKQPFLVPGSGKVRAKQKIILTGISTQRPSCCGEVKWTCPSQRLARLPPPDHHEWHTSGYRD